MFNANAVNHESHNYYVKCFIFVCFQGHKCLLKNNIDETLCACVRACVRVCACVRACMCVCACVRARVCVCGSACLSQAIPQKLLKSSSSNLARRLPQIQ